MSLTDTEAQNIQGIGIAGFRKDHQQLIFVKIDDPAGGRALLAELASRTANAWEVKQFNDLFGEIAAREREPLETIRATWIATLISASGYSKLGVNLQELPAGSGSDAFRAGMAARADSIGDTRANDAPTQWLEPFRPGNGVDLLIVAASDDPTQLGDVCEELHDRISAHHCTAVFDELGETLPADLRGHEHFGFKDGISQPAIDGWDAPPAAGEPAALPMGEFVLGYPDQAGQTTPVGDLWKDGSFAIFRRLRQDVFGFRQQADTNIPDANPQLSPAQLEAKLVGRWPSGAPVELSPNVDSNDVTNAFDYDQDGDGFNVPRFAHIRKANPRHEPRPDLDQDPTERHRMIRRGSPYGPPLDPAATADDGTDRGLHFISIVADPARQFEFVQANWMDNPNFPNGGAPAEPGGPYQPPQPGTPADGPDPVAGHFDNDAQDALNQQPSGFHPFGLIHEFVTLSGGEYFFIPSLPALKRLAEGATSSSPTAPAQ
jgi:Dyp-type peroxidase family